MPQQSRLLHNLDTHFTSTDVDHGAGAQLPCNPRYLSSPTYGGGGDIEYEYIHPCSVEGHQLQAQGYQLPPPSAFSHVASLSTHAQLDPLTCPLLPPVSTLLNSPPRLTPLSSDIINTMSLQVHPRPVLHKSQFPTYIMHHTMHLKHVKVLESYSPPVLASRIHLPTSVNLQNRFRVFTGFYWLSGFWKPETLKPGNQGGHKYCSR